MEQRKNDLTQGSILSKLLMVAVPIMGTQLLQMSYNLIDTFWLGRLGGGAVAASGTAGMFMWLSQAFLMIGRVGAEIGVAQSLGRDNPEGAKTYAQNALFLAATLGTAFGVFLIALRHPLVGFFNIQEAAVTQMTLQYLVVVAVAMPLNFVQASLVGSFTASGNSRTPFLANALGLVVNIILDPLMIFRFGWGIGGAALATVVAQVISCALMVLAMKKDRGRPFASFRFFVRPQMAFIRRILAWSVPIGMESLLFTLMAMVTSRFVAAFGTDAMAVSRVGSQIESLTWLVGGGFGSALTAFMGQNFGAGKWTRIRAGFSLSTRAMALYGLAVTALVFFLGGSLFAIFLPDPMAIAMGRTYLQILAVCQIPQCLEVVAASTFKGIGRTLPPSVVSVASNLLRVVLAYLLARTQLGLNGIWWAIALTATLRGVWGFVWYLLASRRQSREDLVVSP